jgi:hypothetical protein
LPQITAEDFFWQLVQAKFRYLIIGLKLLVIESGHPMDMDTPHFCF